VGVLVCDGLCVTVGDSDCVPLAVRLMLGVQVEVRLTLCVWERVCVCDRDCVWKIEAPEPVWVWLCVVD